MSQQESPEMRQARRIAEEKAKQHNTAPWRAEELRILRPIRIRLKVDLTRYHPGLVKDTEGTTRFERATWGVWCNFPMAGRWDIVEASLEIIDQEFLQLQAEDRVDQLAREEKAERAALETGTTAIWFWHPSRSKKKRHGRFSRLLVFYGSSTIYASGQEHWDCDDEIKAEKCKKALQDRGVVIKQVIEPGFEEVTETD